MSYGHAGVWHVFVNHLCYVRKVADAVVDEVDLPVARHLEVDGIGDDFCSESVDFRLYGITVGWRCLYDAEVACPD